MAEVKDNQEVKPPPFLEVLCKSSGKISRFSAGTEAGFAVNLINKKLLNGDGELAMASHIEAVKEEEEEEKAVCFGPNSMLVDYGPGWKLQTAVESYDDAGGVNVRRRRVQRVSTKLLHTFISHKYGQADTASAFTRRRTTEVDDSDSTWSPPQSPLTCLYIGKILFALLLLFVFGAAFTLVLENLPRFIFRQVRRSFKHVIFGQKKRLTCMILEFSVWNLPSTLPIEPVFSIVSHWEHHRYICK